MAGGLQRVVQDLENETQKANNTITTAEWRLSEIARPYLGSCDLSRLISKSTTKLSWGFTGKLRAAGGNIQALFRKIGPGEEKIL